MTPADEDRVRSRVRRKLNTMHGRDQGYSCVENMRTVDLVIDAINELQSEQSVRVDL